MSPDDPRHGSEAGAIAHWKDGERPCQPCRDGALRASKRRKLEALRRGEPALVHLGTAAHGVIADTNRTILARGTGINVQMLRKYLLAGPEKMVHRTTRDKILTFRRPWTPVGIQRRLRALSVAGWSMLAVADQCGVAATSLSNLRRNEHLRYVRVEFAEKILTAWDQLVDTPPPSGHSARETSAYASARGWFPADVWDDIDDPAENPTPADDPSTVDEVAVQRVLDGDGCQPTTRAERFEIVRRWLADGRSVRSLEVLTGWKVDRYRPSTDTTDEMEAAS